MNHNCIGVKFSIPSFIISESVKNAWVINTIGERLFGSRDDLRVDLTLLSLFLHWSVSSFSLRSKLSLMLSSLFSEIGLEKHEVSIKSLIFVFTKETNKTFDISCSSFYISWIWLNFIFSFISSWDIVVIINKWVIIIRNEGLLHRFIWVVLQISLQSKSIH